MLTKKKRKRKKAQRRQVAFLKVTQLNTRARLRDGLLIPGDLISPGTFKIFSIPDFLVFRKAFWGFCGGSREGNYEVGRTLKA